MQRFDICRTYFSEANELTRAQDTGKAEEIEAWLELLADAYDVLPMHVTKPNEPLPFNRGASQLIHLVCRVSHEG